MLTFRDMNDAVCDCRRDDIDDEGWRFCKYSNMRCRDAITFHRCKALRDLAAKYNDEQEAIEMEEERRGYK